MVLGRAVWIHAMSDDAKKKAREFYSPHSPVVEMLIKIPCKHRPQLNAIECWECGPEAIAVALREAYDQSPERIRTLMAERYGASSACDILQAEVATLKAEIARLNEAVAYAARMDNAQE